MRISEELRAQIVDACRSGSKTNKQIAEEFGINPNTVAAIMKRSREDGEGISLDAATAKHRAVMEHKRAEHEEQTRWMEHVTPLHQHKQRLEAEIAARQEALDKAKAEYRNFLATLRQLMEEQT